jgi:hypothetical protein
MYTQSIQWQQVGWPPLPHEEVVAIAIHALVAS